jgi:hypothetical protein
MAWNTLITARLNPSDHVDELKSQVFKHPRVIGSMWMMRCASISNAPNQNAVVRQPFTTARRDSIDVAQV